MKLLLLIVWALIPSSLHAFDFCDWVGLSEEQKMECASDFCKLAGLSPVEKMVCEHSGVRALDKALNKAYQHLIDTSPTPSRHKLTQRHWLSSVRNTCRESDCLRRVYSDRLIRLLEEGALSREVNASKMDNTEIGDICNGVAELARTRKLYKALTPGLPLNLEVQPEVSSDKWALGEEREKVIFESWGPPYKIFNIKLGERKELTTFAFISTGGTCPSSEIFNVAAVSDPQTEDYGRDDVGERDQELSTMGTYQSLAVYERRNIVVTGNLRRPEGVSWIKPDGRIRPLCVLEVVSVQKVEDSSKDREVCTAFAKGEVVPEPWADVTDAIPKDGRGDDSSVDFSARFGSYADFADRLETLFIDLDGNGTRERVGRFSSTNGGGCGHQHSEWLGEISENLDGSKSGAMNTALHEVEAGFVEVFRYRGEYFLQVANPQWGSSSKVYRFRNNTVSEVCAFGESVTSRIRTFFLSE